MYFFITYLWYVLHLSYIGFAIALHLTIRELQVNSIVMKVMSTLMLVVFFAGKGVEEPGLHLHNM